LKIFHFNANSSDFPNLHCRLYSYLFVRWYLKCFSKMHG